MMVEHAWLEQFPDLKLWALDRSMSDHCPIFLETERIDWGPKPFRSLDAWFTHPDFINFVKKEWQLLGEDTVNSKFRKFKTPLKNWNKNVFGNIDQTIKKLESELDIIDRSNESRNLDEVEVARKLALQSLIEKWYMQKELYWRQMSREKYFKSHD